MKTTLRLALGILAATAPAWLMLRASEPDEAPATGKVVVLTNERTLEGDIERVGNQYRLRRSSGELWLSGEHVLRLCTSYEDAYKYLHSRANPSDPDEHLRLATWCHLRGLSKQALAEVQAAVNLRPEHADSQRLLRNLQRAQVRDLNVTVQRTEQPEASANIQPPPINTESLSLYITKVQPTVMNACAQCHASGRGGSFKLVRTFEGNRKITQQNLASVLAQINYEKPSSSPLLVKAVSVHGDMVNPPLKSKEMPAYQVLEDWVRLTLTSNPQLVEQALGSTTAKAFLVAPPEQPVSKAEPTGFAEESVQKQAPKSEPKDAAKRVEPADPFDPAIFNRQLHPDKK